MAGIIIRPKLFTPEDYGALGDGTTDDTTAIQSALTAAAGGGKVLLGNRTYRITAALNKPKSVIFEGVGVQSLRQSLTTSLSFDTIMGLQGSVIRQDTAGANVINVPDTAGSSYIRGMGLTFGAAIRHRNTGHGIYGVPTSTYLGGHDHGICEGEWNDIVVFGHDGNHYAYNTINPLLLNFRNLRSYGGGGHRMECDSFGGNYGNAILDGCYSMVYCLGTAHGAHFLGRATGSTGLLNLLGFHRFQVNLHSTSAFPGETTPPNEATQEGVKFGANVSRVYILGLDVEPETVKVTLPADRFFHSAESIPGDRTGKLYDIWSVPTVSRKMKSDLSLEGSGYYDFGASAYMAGARPGLGTTPPSPVQAAATSGDHSGTVTFGTGSAPSAGQMVRMTLHQTSRPAGRIFLNANNAATQALGLYATKNMGGAGNAFMLSFDVCAANAPAALQANTVYSFDFRVEYST